MSKYKAIIYDLDGTLVKTNEEYILNVVGRTFTDLGCIPCPKRINDFWYGNDRDQMIKEVLKVCPIKFREVLGKYDTPNSRKNAAILYSDVYVVKELKKNGYKQGIVTGAPKSIADMHIELLGPENFDQIIIQRPDNGLVWKPDPIGIEQCLKKIGVEPQAAIYIGNAEEDVIAAKNAGVLDVLIERGEYSFKEPKPSLKIKKLYDLRDMLKIDS